MDIETLRCVLALHAALYFKPKALSLGIEAILRQQAEQCSSASMVRITEQIALRNRSTAAWDTADLALRWRSPVRCIILKGSAEYPANLANIADPPPVLFVDGNEAALNAPQIGIVGSRDATPSGCDTAFWLAGELCASGFAITSGLARGIDGAAHRGALAKDGQTLAILGCGIDRVYPRIHEKLARQISQSGALVSELPLGVPPLALHFPLRNRIISGLGAGVIVVEANLSSGSLITARLALEQGREVFAVPGSIRNPWTRGCHALIRQGAVLIEGPEDILEALPSYTLPAALRLPELRGNEAIVLARVPQDIKNLVLKSAGFEPVSADVLLERTGLTMNMLSSILLEMELSGEVRSLHGGLYERTGKRGHS